MNPAMDELTQRFYDQEAASYESVRKDSQYHNSLRARHVDLLEPLCRGRDVLEVGCGTGFLRDALRPVAKSITGVDISRAMVAKSADRGLNALVAPATELPFGDARFDCVYSCLVLPHVTPLSSRFKDRFQPGATCWQALV